MYTYNLLTQARLSSAHTFFMHTLTHSYVIVAKADMAKKPAVKDASLVNCGAELSLNAEGMISIAPTWMNVPLAMAAMIPKVLLSVWMCGWVCERERGREVGGHQRT